MLKAHRMPYLYHQDQPGKISVAIDVAVAITYGCTFYQLDSYAIVCDKSVPPEAIVCIYLIENGMTVHLGAAQARKPVQHWQFIQNYEEDKKQRAIQQSRTEEERGNSFKMTESQQERGNSFEEEEEKEVEQKLEEERCAAGAAQKVLDKQNAWVIVEKKVKMTGKDSFNSEEFKHTSQSAKMLEASARRKLEEAKGEYAAVKNRW